ncbi:MAG: site-specific DNA-methyltransferase [Candidatus Sumerlaeia bacterium]|nr:site-specific DNA-methyltransferase [Candidatus Sumerlaeia bacterium]
MGASSRGELPRLDWNGRDESMAALEDARASTRPGFHVAESFSESRPTGSVYQGDNLHVMSHLWRRGERFQLIYADPPFFVGRNFRQKSRIKLPSGQVVPIQLDAYEDHWNRDEATYLSMILPRLVMMRDLLADTGVVCLHADQRMIGYLRALLDEIFGRDRFRNEIIWNYAQGSAPSNRFPCKHDTILVYIKGRDAPFNTAAARLPFTPHAHDKRGKNYGGTMGVDGDGREYVEKWGTGKKKKYRYYLDEGKACPDVWTDIQSIQSAAGERTGYPTQKPLLLLERLISVYTNPGDSVGDFFAGSGTTAVSAQNLGRKWTVSDASSQAIHQIRRRLLSGSIPYRALRSDEDPIPPLSGRAVLRDNSMEVCNYTPDANFCRQLGVDPGDDHVNLIDIMTVDTNPARDDECHRVAAHWCRKTPDESPRTNPPAGKHGALPSVFATDLSGRRVSLAVTTD